jgi:hypothetical protein
MFKFKKWLWTKYQAMMGADRAYAKYLAHYNHYQAHVVDKALQQELNIKPMTKEAFLQAWQPKKKSKTGCCS